MMCNADNWIKEGGKWKKSPCTNQATQELSVIYISDFGNSKLQTRKVCDFHAKKINEKHQVINQIKIK